MPLVSTEDLIWPIAIPLHAEVKHVLSRARIHTRVPAHLGVQTIFLLFLGFDHVLEQAVDLGTLDLSGLFRRFFGHDQLGPAYHRIPVTAFC